MIRTVAKEPKGREAAFLVSNYLLIYYLLVTCLPYPTLCRRARRRGRLGGCAMLCCVSRLHAYGRVYIRTASQRNTFTAPQQVRMFWLQHVV